MKNASYSCYLLEPMKRFNNFRRVYGRKLVWAFAGIALLLLMGSLVPRVCDVEGEIQVHLVSIQKRQYLLVTGTSRDSLSALVVVRCTERPSNVFEIDTVKAPLSLFGPIQIRLPILADCSACPTESIRVSVRRGGKYVPIELADQGFREIKGP